VTADPSFADFLRRVRSGDAAAAAELVRRYETAVRVAVRARLTDAGLRRRLDTSDVCQSVLGSFFARAAAGQFDLAEPAQLVALLVRMARHKLADQVRHHRRDCRDVRRTERASGDKLAHAAAPDRLAAGRELLAEVRARLTADERAVADRRGAGATWDEVAAELGGTAEARRKQLTRALDRVAAELGLADAV
jgi:RNA polymerase sigma-70 factor (ECF subfamily)